MKTIKPWGFEILWAHTAHYVGKILFIKAGHRLSLQVHGKKHETIRVESGEGEFFVAGGSDPHELSKRALKPDDVVQIAPGMVHRIAAKTDLKLYEVSTTELDDIFRYEDDYGRI